MASLAMIAFAQLLVIILAEIDLSVGAVYGLAATHSRVLARGWQLALPGSVHRRSRSSRSASGCSAGASSAFFTTVLGMPSFIPTLGMLSIAQGRGVAAQ